MTATLIKLPDRHANRFLPSNALDRYGLPAAVTTHLPGIVKSLLSNSLRASIALTVSYQRFQQNISRHDSRGLRQTSAPLNG